MNLIPEEKRTITENSLPLTTPSDQAYIPTEHEDYYIEPDSNLYTWHSRGSTFGSQYSGGLFYHPMEAAEDAEETLSEEYKKNPSRFPIHKYRDNWEDYQKERWSDSSLSGLESSSFSSEDLYIAVRALVDGFTTEETTEMISTNSWRLDDLKKDQGQLAFDQAVSSIVSDALNYIRQEHLPVRTQKSEYLVHQNAAFWELYSDNHYEDASLPGIMAQEVQSVELYAATHALCDGFTEKETTAMLATNSPRMRFLSGQGDDKSVHLQSSATVKTAIEYLRRKDIAISREQLSIDSLSTEIASRLFQNFSASAIVAGRSLEAPMNTTIGEISYSEEEDKAVISVVNEDRALLFQAVRDIFSPWQVAMNDNRLSGQDIEKIYSIPLTVRKVSGDYIFKSVRQRQDADLLPRSTTLSLPTEQGDYEFRVEQGDYKLSINGTDPLGEPFFYGFEEEGIVSVFFNKDPVENAQRIMKALNNSAEISNDNEL